MNSILCVSNFIIGMVLISISIITNTEDLKSTIIWKLVPFLCGVCVIVEALILSGTIVINLN